jgi:hypothetical protein
VGDVRANPFHRGEAVVVVQIEIEDLRRAAVDDDLYLARARAEPRADVEIVDRVALIANGNAPDIAGRRRRAAFRVAAAPPAYGVGRLLPIAD